MYRVYLRNFNQQILEKTNTPNQEAASAAFEEMVNRAEFDGQKLAAVITFKNRQLAFHRFDRQPGDVDYWRGRLDEIEWPEIGRPSTLTGGRRANIYIDAPTELIAKIVGNGSLSEGLRIIAEFYRENRKPTK